MKTDHELLREYADDRSNAAFGELVQRHGNQVYHSALRQVNSPDQAKDISQAVFTILSQKAGGIPMKTPLIAWLLTVTRCVAINHIRKNVARKRREEAVAAEIADVSATDSLWQAMSPFLDDALSRLRDKDRQVLLLRYFRQMSYDSIAQEMGIKDNAARKCAERAIEKLRGLLARQGVAVSSGVLPTMLIAAGSQAVPAELLEALMASTLHGLEATGVVAELAKGGIKMMFIAKAKAVAATVLTVGVLGSGVVVAATTALKAGSGSGGKSTDWPQYGGPNRDSIVVNSPKLADSWPTNGPALVWKSGLIPGYTQGGCSGPVVAGGKVFVYATAKKPVGGGPNYDIITPDALASAGWQPGLPEELSKKIEEVRLSPKHPIPPGASFTWWEIRNEEERKKAADEYLAKSPELDQYIKDFLATLPQEEARKYGAYIRYRFCARPRLGWNVDNGLPRATLEALAKLQGQKVATMLDCGRVLGDAWKLGVGTPMFNKYLLADKFVTCAWEKSFTRVDQMTCLDAATGKKLWAKEIPMDAQALAWFKTSDGNMWFNFLGVCGAPAVAAGRCYFSGFNGLYCLSTKDGAILWKTNVPPTQTSVLVANGVVYYNGVAYRADTGAELWRTPLWRAGTTSPLIWRAGGKDYVVDANGGKGLFCVELQTGKEAWTCKESRWWLPLWFALRRDGDLMTVNGTVYRMTPTAVTKVQTNVDGKHVMNGGIIDQGYLYQETHPGEGPRLKNQGLNCWDLKTGEDKWNCDVTAKDLKGVMSADVRPEVNLGAEGDRLTPSILADGKILMSISDLPYRFWHGDKAMDVLMMRATPEKFEPLGCFAAGMIPFAPMALADGRLFIRTVTGISCYDLRAK